MSIYCYKMKSNDSFSQRSIERTQLIDIKLLFCINIDNLTEIIKGVLSDFCNADVIGYDKKMNKYWCKTYDKKFCSLHIELEIIKNKNDTSTVKIIPLIGTDILLENFASNFRESIELYTTSSFIRECLARN